MKALRIKNSSITLREIKKPQPIENEALVKVMLAGISTTDRDIINGNLDFNGTLGHEFVGVVEECETSPELIGKRVVGEINSGCLNISRVPIPEMLNAIRILRRS